MGDPSNDTKAFLDVSARIEERRSEFDSAQLLQALGSALEKAGHVRLVRAVEESASSDHLTGLFIPVLFWGLGASIGIALGVSVLAWVILAFALFFAYAIIANTAPKASGPVAGLLVMLWAGAALGMGVWEGSAVLWTHGIPVALLVVLGVALRSLRLQEARDVALALAGVARSAPYLVPVVLVAVLLPALTADVWQLAASVGTANLLGAAVLTVGVLLVFVRRQLHRELEPALAGRSRSLASRAETPELTRRALIQALDGADGKIINELPAETMSAAWPQSADEYAPYLAAAESRSLRRPLTVRLLITASSIALLLASYIYVLLAVTVPTSVASEWSDSAADSHPVEFLGMDLSLPGDPYVAMATLLGILATAIFLAFALTEERISAAVTEALLREPIDRFLLLALPFISLLEWGLEDPDRLQFAPDRSDPRDPVESGGGEVNSEAHSSRRSNSGRSTRQPSSSNTKGRTPI